MKNYLIPNSFIAPDNQIKASCCTFGLFCVNAKSTTISEIWPSVLASAMAVRVSATAVPFLASENFSEISVTQQFAVVIENLQFSAKYFKISNFALSTWKFVSFKPGLFERNLTKAWVGIVLTSKIWISDKTCSEADNLELDIDH